MVSLCVGVVFARTEGTRFEQTLVFTVTHSSQTSVFTTKLAETSDALLVPFRYRLQKFGSLAEFLALLQKMKFVECGKDDFLDGSESNASFCLFLDSVFQKACKFKVERAHFGSVLLGAFNSSFFQLLGNVRRIGW